MLGLMRSVAAWVVARLSIRSERGASALEYGILASLIAAAIVVAVALLGNSSKGNYDCTVESIQAHAKNC